MDRRLVVGLGVSIGLLVAGCGAAVKAPVVTDSTATTKVAERWQLFTDAERFTAIWPTASTIWVLSVDGLGAWDRATRRYRAPQPGAPHAAKIIVEGDDGVVYVGGADGLDWRDDTGWHHYAEGLVARGIFTLVAAEGGGVWVAMPKALGRFSKGEFKLVSERYTARSLVRAPAGAIWAGTDRFGVVRIDDTSAVEFTTGQGLCGDRIIDLSAHPDGRVVALCASQGQGTAFAIFDGTAWQSHLPRGLGTPLTRVSFGRQGLVVASANRWFAVTEGAAPPGTVGSTPISYRHLKSPPLQEIPAKAPVAKAPVVKAPAAEEPATKAPATKAPATKEPAAKAPATKAPAAKAPATNEVQAARPDLPAQRASDRVARLIPNYVLRELKPSAGQRSSATALADGAIYLAIPHRGITQIEGAQRTRFTTMSLAPADPTSRLAIDAQGRAAVITADGRVYRWNGAGWATWRIGAGPVLGLAFADGRSFAITADPIEASGPDAGTTKLKAGPGHLIRVLAARGTEAFVELSQLRIEDLEGRPKLGGVSVDRRQTLSFPLYAQRADGTLGGAGLGRILDGGTRLEIWQAASSYSTATGPALPDAWVSAVDTDDQGAVIVATNAGLAVVSGGEVAVFDENAFIDSEVILDVAVGPDGTVWAGTLEGLGALVGGEWRAAKLPALGGRVVALSARGGRLLAVTEAQLFVREDGAWTPAPSEPSNLGVIQDIAQGADGSVWLLTSQGVARYGR